MSGVAIPAGSVARECPYNHPEGTRCPACADWPYKKGGAAAYTEAYTPRTPAQPEAQRADVEREALKMLAERGRFPSGGAVPFDVASSLIAAALASPPAEPTIGAKRTAELIAVISCMDAMLADPTLDALAFDKHDARLIRAALAAARPDTQNAKGEGA